MAFVPQLAVAGATSSPFNGRSCVRSASTPALSRRTSRATVMVLEEVRTGDAHLSPEALERAKVGNKFEKLKLKKDGSAMWTEVHELAQLLKEGKTKWEDINTDDIDIRLKWAGLFHRRKRTPGRFMMRLKVPNGILTSSQLRYFASVLAPYGDDGCADITTRMNIQLRGITLDDAAEVCDGLYANGLTSYMSGMDNVRNMVGSPIAGIDPMELVDTRPLCIEINDMITNNRRGRPELTNLPRKFNIAVSGSRDDFAHTHINDIGLVPIPHDQTGEIGFNVVIGGFFSIKRNAEAIPMDVWVPQDDVVRFCENVLLWFRDNGDRKNRQATRLMYMVDKHGMDGFRNEIESTMGSELLRAMKGDDSYSTPVERRNVLGVHAQKQPGLNWVGACVPAGRLHVEDIEKIASVADKYCDGEVRLTVEQNLIFPNVKDEALQDILKEDLFSKFMVSPGRIVGNLVSCTGAQFCGIALIETKNRAIALAEELERVVEVPRDVRIHWTGCPNSCGQVQVADIGLMGCPARKDGKAVEGVRVFVGGKIGEQAHLGEEIMKGIPATSEDLVPVLSDILVDQFGATRKQ
ncbi:Nitrite and sulphite reductase 4Fe-4S [Gracilaria domingensis]|nr:Nitrite and sulphite reductase 4Fe-4S [Gracilaria domingensis]